MLDMMISTTVSRGTATMEDIFCGGSMNDDDDDDVGLRSCTESLGFESSDERMVLVDDRIIHESLNKIDEELCSRKVTSFNKIKKEVAIDKKFPPPLSSLSQDGRPTFYLRPVRGNGRLMLTEVKIVRPEILRASRQDGRLRLHLVQDIQEQDENDANDEEAEEMQDINEEYIQEENLTEEELEGWQFSATPACGGDGLRRCYEQGSINWESQTTVCMSAMPGTSPRK